MLETKMTEMLGVKYPIQCGTMHGLTTAEVVAPVAEAGCFCCLPASYYESKEELLEEVEKVRDRTDQPFGINVALFPELNPTFTAEERIDWVIESGVKILETAGRSPEPQRKQISDAGLIHIHKCARVRDAVKAEKVGVDIVSIVGTECGGHPSMEEVGFIVLIPAAIDAISVPLIAGGGICDGRSVIAALALGAAGVNIGTRFMATKDFPIHREFKDKLIEWDEKRHPPRHEIPQEPQPGAANPVVGEDHRGGEPGGHAGGAGAADQRWRQQAWMAGRNGGTRHVPGWAGHRADSRRPDDVGAGGEDRRRSRGDEGDDRSAVDHDVSRGRRDPHPGEQETRVERAGRARRPG